MGKALILASYFEVLGKPWIRVGDRRQIAGEQLGVDFCNFVGSLLILEYSDEYQANEKGNQRQDAGRSPPKSKIVSLAPPGTT